MEKMEESHPCSDSFLLFVEKHSRGALQVDGSVLRIGCAQIWPTPPPPTKKSTLMLACEHPIQGIVVKGGGIHVQPANRLVYVLTVQRLYFNPVFVIIVLIVIIFLFFFIFFIVDNSSKYTPRLNCKFKGEFFEGGRFILGGVS